MFSKLKIKESNFNHVIFYTLFRVTYLFQSSKVKRLCCFPHWSHFCFIEIVNKGCLDGRWHLKPCSYNLLRTALSDTTKSRVFSSFVIWSMFIFLFCLQKFTNILSIRSEVFFFAPHFPIRLAANSSQFSNFLFIWDTDACDMHIFLEIFLCDILVFWSNAEMADFFLGVRSFVFPIGKEVFKVFTFCRKLKILYESMQEMM
jgi:hypothetical protein